jgi:hypothetical protein
MSTTEPYTSKTLTQAERSDLAYDLQGTLKHKRSGIMAIWAYMNGGKEPLERLFRKENYHGEKEKPYIAEIARKLARSDSFPKRNISLMDLGHGMASEKIISFIDAFNIAANENLADGEAPSNRFLEVIGIDIVPQYGEDFREKLSAYFEDVAHNYGGRPISVRTVTKKYSDISEPLEVEGDAVMASFNTPLWNSPLNIEDMTPADILPKALKYAARIVDQGGHIVTNHYISGADDDALYDSADCRDAIAAILKLIQNELEPVCYKNNGAPESEREYVPFSQCFNYSTFYDADTNTRRMDVVSKDDFIVEIGDHFYKTMDKNEPFCLVSAAKLNKKDFEQHVKNAGIFEQPKADHRIAMRDEANSEIFGYSCAIQVNHSPEL